jgi:site-specific recombinase XerD
VGNNTPIKGTIEPVPHLPDYVVVYRIPSSKFYWIRVWTQNKRYVIRSSKTTYKKEAFIAARQLYIESLTNNLVVAKTNPKSMVSVAESLLAQEKAGSKLSLFNKDRNMLRNAILPHFGTKLLTDVSHADLTEYLGKLNEKELSPATKKHHMGLIAKVFNHGILLGVIHAKPAFPKASGKFKTALKRDYLTIREYKHLNKTILDMERRGVKFRGTPITREHKLLCQFMVNSFLRPSDLRVLKHKHVQRASDSKSKWLVLTHPATKTTENPVLTMPRAVIYYDELLKLRGEVSPDDYVFFPEFQNRTTGMNKLGKIFAKIMDESKLEQTTGKNLPMYSLRHTSLMFRILYSSVDPLTLAKNARTSVDQLEKYYLSHLTTEQGRKRLHSFTS